MKQFQLKTLLSAVAILFVLSACHKDKNDPTPDKPTAERAGVYVLNEGSFNSNNSSLTYYDYTTKVTTPDLFTKMNGAKGLGDTGNDIQVYGSKMYIVVNVSSTIEVVDPKTAKSIKHIDMKEGGKGREPRSIVFYKNKAFISSFDGTVAVLDTASLTFDKFIKVGRNPDQLVIANDKLYVANSGGLGATPDKTVSVIDLKTLTETIKIEVALNPTTIATDAYGDVYVISYGTYPSTPKLTIIDNKTDKVKSTKDIDAGYGTPFLVNGDVAYYYTSLKKINVYDVKTEIITKDNFVSDGTALVIPYALAVDNATGELFVTDALSYSGVNGLLYAFDKNGNKEYSITTGINPGSIVLVNK